MKLYTYWRSTTAVRVRIALNLKQISHDNVFLDLTAGEHRQDAFARVNPSKGVPVLELDDGTVLTQSLAICDYLDDLQPTPPLYPADPVQRARVRAGAHLIGMEIHPVNNLKVLGRIKEMGHSQDECVDWMHHWMREGFRAYQGMIDTGRDFSFGDDLTIADICLVGQMVNARRWGLDCSEFAALLAIDDRARAIPAVAAGLPDAQPDADPNV